MRTQLRQWAKFSFGSIKLKTLALPQDVEALDIVKESRRLTLVESQKMQELFDKLKDIHKEEELYRKQRSRIQWLKEGNENTKFFNTVANGRKNRNFIPYID